MAGSLNVLNAPSYNLEADLKIFFDNSIGIETRNYGILNKYARHKFNQYANANAKNYSLWDYI